MDALSFSDLYYSYYRTTCQGEAICLNKNKNPSTFIIGNKARNSAGIFCIFGPKIMFQWLFKTISNIVPGHMHSALFVCIL